MVVHKGTDKDDAMSADRKRKCIVMNDLYPAAVTPFNQDPSVHIEWLRTHLHTIASTPRQGLVDNGGLGALLQLSAEEEVLVLQEAAFREVFTGGQAFNFVSLIKMGLTQFQPRAASRMAVLRNHDTQENVSRRLRECIEACERCAELGDDALVRDPAYTSPGTDQYSEYHLALITCVSTCQVTAQALSSGNGDLAELCEWCAEVCARCAEMVREKSSGEHFLEVACMRCADRCEAFGARVGSRATSARGQSRSAAPHAR